MRNPLKTYFKFSKKEYNGIFILCLLMIVMILSRLIYQMFRKPTIYEFDQFKQEIEAFKESAQKEQKQDLKSQKNTIEKKELKPIYVPFDPNGLSEEQWHMLGLSDRQIKVIKNYESKGGKFYKKEDLKKIYSIKPDQYTQLEPYISIQVTKSTTSHPSSSEFKSNQNLNSINTRIVIDLKT